MDFGPVCKAVQDGSSSRLAAVKEENVCPPDVVTEKSAARRFGSENRLRTPEAYKSLFASGKRTGDQHFLFIYGKNNLSYARLGLAVPKKNIRLATKRNRIKRLIRESFRSHKSLLKGLDIIVLVRRQPDTDCKSKNRNRLDRNWKIIKI